MELVLKKIEKLIKRISRSQTQKLREQLPYLSDIIMEYDIKKILFLRQDRIGDLIISEPVLRILKDKYPFLQLDILLSKSNQSAVCGISQLIDNYHIYQKEWIKDWYKIKELKSAKYDLIVDLMDKKSSTSALLIKLIKPKYAAGLAKENSHIYNFIVPRLNDTEAHIIDRTGKLLTLFGIDTNSVDLSPKFSLETIKNTAAPTQIQRLINEGNKIFLINLSGSNRSKYWGEENYIEFINLASNCLPEHKFVLVYTKDYSESANIIAKSSPAILSNLFDSFADYAYALSLADVILTPDTAAVHLASAFKKKCIVLYNQDLENANILKPWFPYKTKYLAFGTKSGNLDEIEPQIVFDSIMKFM